MAWLWIISVGVTDIQFPVWSKDTYGQWTGPRRFETGRAGIRAVHEGLLALLHRDQIRFESGEPEAVRNARDLRLEFFQEDGAFLAAIRPEEYRISRWADTIPNDREDRLPLYCPKVEALLPIARETFAGGPVTVLVLNTRRAVDFREGPGEPIAAGPLVSKCLAERLGLQWCDGQGQVPMDLGLGTSTWVDILTGDEATEDADAQGNLIRRLNAAIRAWNPGGGSRQVVVTTSGGIPPLKPIIERVPATAVGQSNVLLLDQPQGGKAAAVPLSYDTRVTERETLRFQCAESLRLGDYASAYGLANRAAKQPWARMVRDGLGALLELPGKPLILSERRLEPYAVCACQIEASLCMGDSAGALVRFGTFIDSTIWALIAGDARIREARLKPDREDECLVGQMLGNHALFEQRLLELNSKGPNRHGVMGLTWRWPQWLAQRAGGQLHASQAIDRLRLAYNGEPRRFRNLLIHGAAEPVDLNEVRRCMRDAGLIAADNLRFGQNFLSTPMLSDLLTGLGSSDLATGIGSQLQNLLNRVIEG